MLGDVQAFRRILRGPACVLPIYCMWPMFMPHFSLFIAGPLIEKDNILRVMPNACLVLHVYCEKLKENSFWKPYLGILQRLAPKHLRFTSGSVREKDFLKLWESFLPPENYNYYLSFVKYCNISLTCSCIVDILPSSYSTTLYFTVEEMQALKGSPAFGKKF